MRSIGQVIDQIDRIIEAATGHALNPDRAPHLREEALYIRRSMVALREYVTADEKEHGTNA